MPPKNNNIVDQYSIMLGEERIAPVDFDVENIEVDAVDGRHINQGILTINNNGITFEGSPLIPNTITMSGTLSSVSMIGNPQIDGLSEQISDLTLLVEELRREIREMREERNGSIS